MTKEKHSQYLDYLIDYTTIIYIHIYICIYIYISDYIDYTRDDYKTDCLLDYLYLKKYFKVIAVDLSKQRGLDADPRAIYQINFIQNLEQYFHY